MKTISKIGIVILFAVLFSCSNRNKIEISSRNFGEEVQLQQNLVFTFNRPIVADSLLESWDTIPFIKFTPEVAGKFRWTSASELVFSPSVGFAAATDYTMQLQKSLAKKAGNAFEVNDGKIAFHTPYLQMTNANGYWAASANHPGKAALKISIEFNYKVDPTMLSSLLKITMKDALTAYQMETSAPGEVITVVIDNLSPEVAEQLPLKFVIEKGLRMVDSKYMTTTAFEKSLSIPSPDKLKITDAVAEYEDLQARIHIFTTQSIDLSTAQAAISFDPAIKFTVEEGFSGFYINGPFVSGSNYRLDISEKLKGFLGGNLESKYSTQVSFGEMEPAISFVNQKGIYMTSKGTRNLALNVVNMPKVNVQIYRIFENNIQHYLRTGRYSDGYYDDEGEYMNSGVSYNTYDIERYANKIVDRVYETKDLAVLNGIHLLNLSFDDVSTYKGIYVVVASSSKDQWVKATKLVSVSDIGLIVKAVDNEVFVFANSIKTAEAMSGVAVNLVSTNNQTIATVKTGSDGIAIFKDLKSKGKGFVPSMVTASIDKDFNYVLFSDTRVDASRFEVGGRRVNESQLMAFIYGDRDIYRPGETIHLNTVIRTEQWQALTDVPVKIKLIAPDGKEFKTIRGKLNKEGAYETSIFIPEAALTGSYSAEIFSANDVLLNSKQISIEEFMPDRIDVKLALTKTEMFVGDSLKATITATNMFGPPASDRNYELQFTVDRGNFYSKSFPQYNFSIKTENASPFETGGLRQGKTDAKGNATEVFTAPEEWSDQGLLSVKAFATVTDETGRPVNRAVSFPIFTQKEFFGIKMNDYYVNRGEKFIIPLIATNKDGKSIATEARVQIVRYDWYSSLERDSYGSRYHYISKKKEVLLADQVIALPASGHNFSYVPRESGEYEIRIQKPGSSRYVSSQFYAYGWGFTNNTSFEVNTEGQIDIQADKEAYKVGDKAKLIFKTPFNGKVLITVECDKVIETRYLKTENRSCFIELPLKENYLPNIYVTATLFRPVDDGSIPLTVAHGFLPLKVERASNHLAVDINCVANSRSRTKQTIKLKSAPNSEFTVSVVDEGILALRRYVTPDPYNYFYQKKALMVEGYDVYASLLPDLKLRRSSTGGDMDMKMAMAMDKRVNPLTNKRVKLVSLWSGIMKTNSAGEASYSIDIPQFSGDLRVMACAYKAGSFGSSDKHIKVADPIVISPSIPRFLSPGDSLVMPVTLTNTTNKPANASALVKVTGSLSINGPAKQDCVIPANSEKKVTFSIVAPLAMGVGKIVVSVNAMNETFNDSTDITIRPATTLVKKSLDGEISGTGAISLQHEFIPSSASATLTISANPMMRLGKQLSYLIGYPYGCVEQTTSTAFPQIYFSELVKNMQFANNRGQSPVQNVQAAIVKLQGMQLYNGSLSYWPGGTYESWWGTAYATHFLVESKKAGYEVNQEIINRCLAYMGQKVKEHQVENDYYYWDYMNVGKIKKIYKKENIYSLYLLALYGKADIASMNFYKSQIEMLALDSRYMLACTYLAIGERKTYEQLLPKSFDGEKSKHSFDGSFYSYLRDEALALNVLLDVDPDNIQIPIMVRHLSQQLNKTDYLNTQEAAYSFLALGKFMRRISQDKVTATITADGKTIGNFNGPELVLKKGIAGKNINVNITGNGKLYYFGEVSGMNAKGDVKEEDKFIKARKSFFNRFGQPINPSNVKQGDLIAVKLTLENMERSKVENIALADILPAGFEIENSRIGEVADMNWIKDQAFEDYLDVRDDRITFFTHAEPKPRSFYYLVRAVSTGTFKMGPVSADAMYNGEYHSYHGAQTIIVR